MILTATIFGAIWRRWWGSVEPWPKWARSLVLILFTTLFTISTEWFAVPLALALWVALTAPHEDWQVWPREALFKLLFNLPLVFLVGFTTGSFLCLALLPITFLASAAWPVFSKLAPKYYTPIAECVYGGAIMGGMAWTLQLG